MRITKANILLSDILIPHCRRFETRHTDNHNFMSLPKLQINARQFQALCAVCNTFVAPIEQDNPAESLFWQLKATDLEVPERILELAATLPPAEQSELKQLFSLLASPLFGLTCFKGLKSIAAMPFKQREAALQSWSNSRIPQIRKAFCALRKITTFLHYGISYNRQPNPNWKFIKYPGPLSAPKPVAKPIQPYFPAGLSHLSCDVVVIGSGAGGGLAAGMLAEAGFEVILLEKGAYLNESDFNQREVEMIQRTYEQQGALTTTDGGVSLFAGSCLGGGTTINWTAAINTPDYILQEWSDKHLLPHLLTDAYRESMNMVSNEANITQSESNHNAQNRYLWRGSELVGNKPKVVPRNVKGCSDDECQSCGYCGFGCQSGNKQGTLKTWIQRAYDRGAKIMVNTTAQKITTKKGKATGVEIVQTNGMGLATRMVIKATTVVVCAGALHTPALLMRSGISHPELGRHLFLHPTVVVSGFYPNAVNPWWGTMISALNDDYARMNENYGVRLETPPAHTGLMALATPWQSAAQHKAYMLRMANAANIIVLTRDKFGGSVTVDRKGYPRYHYALQPFDRTHLLAGIEKSARILLAAGAEEIIFPHHRLRHITGNTTENALLKFFNQMPEWGWKSGQFSLFSAHQMGTCRMGGNIKTHPLTPEGEMVNVKGLYVADASAFPASSGVNPMMSIMALSHYTIKQLIDKRK